MNYRKGKKMIMPKSLCVDYSDKYNYYFRDLPDGFYTYNELLSYLMKVKPDLVAKSFPNQLNKYIKTFNCDFTKRGFNFYEKKSKE